MNDHELVRVLNDAFDALQRVLAAFETVDKRDGNTTLVRMRESQNGWPSGSGFDRGARKVTDEQGDPMPLHSDPTGEAAMRRDRAHDDRLALERDAKTLQHVTRHIADLAARYTLRDANPVERQVQADDNGCSSCARIPGPRTAHWWNPRHRGDLCRWCLDFQRATGRLPTVQELTDYRDGKKVRRTA